MTPVAFPRANCLFGAPEKWDETAHGECHPLPAAVQGNLVTTAWRLDELELQKLKNGGLITLTIYGGQPPVILGVVAEKDLELRSAAAG